MTLPIDRTALIAATTNQVPNSIIRSAQNIAAITTPYNTIDELYSYVNSTLAGIYDLNKYGRLGIINVLDPPYNAVGDGVTDDTTALQAAANAGGVIILPSGTYKITSTLQTASANTIFLFQRGAKLMIVGADVSGILINHDNCKVLNGHFDGASQSTTNISNAYGVRLAGVKGCDVTGNTFENIVGHNIFLSYVGTTGCENCIIDRNRILTPNSDQTFFDTAGIMIGYSGVSYFHVNNQVTNNYIHGNDKLFLGVAIIGHGKQNRVSGNTIYNCNAYGIVSYNSDYVDFTLLQTIVEDNHVENIGSIVQEDKGMGIYFLRSDDSAIKNNTVINAIRHNIFTGTLAQGGIGVSASIGVSVSQNNVEECNCTSSYGIYISQDYDSNVTGNTVKNSANGIIISECNDVTVNENSVNSVDGYGIKVIHTQVVEGRTGYVDTGKRINVINNIIRCSVDTAIGIYFEGASGFVITHCIISKNNIKHTANNDCLKLEYISLSSVSGNIIFTSGANSCIVTDANATELMIENNILNTTGSGPANGGIKYFGTKAMMQNNYLNGTPVYPYFYNDNIFANPTKTYYGTAIPTVGVWAFGDTIYNIAPAASGYMGWICTIAGTPGTWKGFGLIEA